MTREFLFRYFKGIESLGIGFRRTRQGTLGSYIESTIVSQAPLSSVFDGMAFNNSYETIEGEDVLVFLAPLWSSCSAFQIDLECLHMNNSNCGWCSLFEECMESSKLLRILSCSH